MPPTSCTALVPLRALGVGKSRLALRLTPEQRATLARAMFHDVVDALVASQVDEVVVAAGDEDAARAARERGLEARLDPPGTSSLDAAITATAETIDTDALLVVTADLPCLRARGIDAVLAQDASVVIAPTHDGGTGALLRRPPDVMGTAYGPDSAERHRALALDAGIRPAIVEDDGLARDVDTWRDLVALSSGRVGPATAAALPELLVAA